MMNELDQVVSALHPIIEGVGINGRCQWQVDSFCHAYHQARAAAAELQSKGLLGDTITIKIGDTVRIVEDEYPELVGALGTVEQITKDGTAAWVIPHDGINGSKGCGIWCDLSDLELENDGRG